MGVNGQNLEIEVKILRKKSKIWEEFFFKWGPKPQIHAKSVKTNDMEHFSPDEILRSVRIWRKEYKIWFYKKWE